MKEKNKINNEEKRKKLKEKGITLVALVVTIIILLILVGVTISQIEGNNGLFSKARQAVGVYKNAEIDEEIAIGKLEKSLEIDNKSETGRFRNNRSV